MISSKDVNGWLYVLIGGSVMVTFLLTSRVLDKMAMPSHLPAPKIFGGEINLVETQELKISQNEVKSTGSRNIHHLAPKPPLHAFPQKQKTSPRPRSSSQPLTEGLGSFSSKIDAAISSERELVAKDLDGYQTTTGEKVDTFLMEKGGSPVRAMVATTWRSGSTFLGDIMTAHPATFYHYEPLLHYDIVQARSGARAEDAVRTLKDLMHCNYTSLGSYLQYGKSHQWLFNHNPRLWAHCTEGGHNFRSSYCWKPEFLNRFCPLFPFQSIKTVRLRLNLTKSLVEDPSLNVKVLLLVRDPRGTIQSRKHRDWCPNNPDCEDPARLCEDLVSDHQSVKLLMKQFPGRYKVFRYEDFSMNPTNNTADVFRFFGFSVHKKVLDFLDSHTKSNKGGVSSTFRDSKTAPFKWRERLSMAEVVDIQVKCEEAMRLWGYRILTEAEDLKTFDPVLDLEHFSLE
eukprot:GFUD01016686.1.p1 GENE.GFUD01016686.1~~GFUD01016686.1.p1  ORF type:complete len:455 (+),score=127.05 GFUD01016686.1:199-1563(+)